MLLLLVAVQAVNKVVQPIILTILEDNMPWINLDSLQQLSQIEMLSAIKPQIIFKHSTRCSVSVMIKNRLEKENWEEVSANFYYLDLLNYREISNAVAEKFKVHHESPQVLVVKNGECIYDESHLGITFEELVENIDELKINN